MKSLLLTLGALAGLLLCVAGIAGVLLSGFDLLYGSASLVVALAGVGVLILSGRAIRTASRAEAEGAPGRRSRQKHSEGHSVIERGRRL
jgi:phosphoserine aminotransferase